MPADTGDEACDPVEEQVGEGGDGGEIGKADEDEVKEAEVPKSKPQPRMPTAEERRAHELTHCPFRSWCMHCVRGQAADYPHRSVTGEGAESDIPRVIMDYCFFKEDIKKKSDDHTESEEARMSLTALVMKETMCGSVWAYALKSKSVNEDPWIVDQIIDDLATVGMSKERIIIKSDQEPAITELQTEIARRRGDYGTGLENSKVGDSNNNGKIERAIRDVGGIVRTLKSFLSEKIGTAVTLDMMIVPWLIRHASYIITRSRVRDHGRTSLRLMKGRVVNTEMLPFGETVLFKIPKTGHAVGSFEERWESGVWIGCTIRDGMHLIGTASGVFKVGT